MHSRGDTLCDIPSGINDRTPLTHRRMCMHSYLKGGGLQPHYAFVHTCRHFLTHDNTFTDDKTFTDNTRKHASAHAHVHDWLPRGVSPSHPWE